MVQNTFRRTVFNFNNANPLQQNGFKKIILRYLWESEDDATSSKGFSASKVSSGWGKTWQRKRTISGAQNILSSSRKKSITMQPLFIMPLPQE